MKTQTETDPYENLIQETRRGILPLAVLSLLKENKYGYALINELAEHGLVIDQGTLYPMLRRLEAQGLLQSSWELSDTRPRRYYQISPAGQQVLEALTADWRNLNKVMEKLLSK